jgi:hypothetical protein
MQSRGQWQKYRMVHFKVSNNPIEKMPRFHALLAFLVLHLQGDGLIHASQRVI